MRGSRNFLVRPQFERLETRYALTAPTVLAVEVASSSWSADFRDYLSNHHLGQFGYAVPSGASQEAGLPWTNLNQVYITFSEDVQVDAADLCVSGVKIGQYEVSGFLYDPQTMTARWTFATPLESDRVLLDLDANGANPVMDLDGNALDGEWTNFSDTFASGNGVAGGDFEFVICPQAGDATQNRFVTGADNVRVLSTSGKSTSTPGYNPAYDINGSGVIDSADGSLIRQRIGQNVPSTLPPGFLNDAPTSSGPLSATLSDAAIDIAFSLYDRFADRETADESLAFSIKGISAPELFDAAYLDASTGELVLNAAAGQSGRAEIVVTAEDAGGLTCEETIVIDVARSNHAPIIDYFFAENLGYELWEIWGVVTDDDESTDGWIIELEGAIETRAFLSEGGWFQFATFITAGGLETLKVTAVDSFGASATDWTSIANT